MGIHDGHREKMRQRFMTGGLDAFADHEILELLLYYAIPRRDTNPIAHALMERYGSLPAVLSAPMEDLKRTEGIGESAAVLLHLVPQVCRRARLAQVGEDQVLNSSERAGAYLLECFDGESREVIYQLCLDRKGKLLACKRLLVENAILTGASAVILAHNHPSGVALPSDGDYTATMRVRAALNAIGIELADHIIVADGDFVSMADSGYLS